MKNFFRGIIVEFAVILEVLKSFLVSCIVIVAIITALSAIIHNVFKIREIYAEDTSGYKNLVSVDMNRINVQVSGEGEQTVVILSDYATPSPILEYKTYTEELVSKGYRVVVIEYFGYGYSLSSKDPRTVSYFVSEISAALTNSEIYGPYIFLASGTSGIYASAYAENYPDSVQKLVLVDSIYPATINEAYIEKQLKDQNFNITLTSFAELTGYARIASYVKPDMFGIDKMQNLGYSSEDIKIYRKMIANRFYTKTMRNEYKALIQNMQEYKDYKFPDYLPVTQILSDEYVKEYADYKSEKLIKKDIETYAKDLITNSEIQSVVTVTGEKNNLNLTNPTSVIMEAGF